MGQIAQKIRASFDAKETRSVVVPEWDVTLTVWPLTIGQLQRIQSEPDRFRQAARIIQVRGKVDGKPFLDESDFEELIAYGVGDWGPVVVARVAGEIMADLPSAEDAEKNS